MRCPKCSEPISLDSHFCPSCGAAIETSNDSTTNAPVRLASANDTGPRGGRRGQKAQKGQVRYYYGHACNAREAVSIVERFFDSLGLHTQIIESGNEVIVQGKQKPNFLRKAFGLDRAITVSVSVDGDDMKTIVGGAKWIDKAAGVAIGWFVFAPAILTAGWGVYKQKQLFARLDEEIGAYLASK